MFKKPILYLAALFLVFSACQDDDSEQPNPIVDESPFIRVLLSDQDKPDYYFLNPKTNKIEVHAGQFAAGRLYTSPGKRFAAVINTDDNLVSFFDSGVEAHDDHAHIKGSPKWALTKAQGSRPVHFYGRGDDMLIFNDGDGTIDHAKESTLHTAPTTRNFSVGVAHHGAPALFKNGTIAVTEKDGSVAGTLPERVKIVDMQGNLLHASTIQTGGIHGEAGNGETVLFGCREGILQVDDDGAQRVIPNPASFGTGWIGTVLYGEASGKFIGVRSRTGLYEIDLEAGEIKTIEESSKLYGVAYDWHGERLVVIYSDGLVKVLDGQSFQTLSSKVLPIDFPASGSVGNPVFSASEEFLYITNGIEGKLSVYDMETLELAKELNLPGKPARIALLGSVAHDEEAH
ncbi:YncE family protein [Roseivirga thermotolerans]|nr:hypothetical protein [Roseivirga thermotolerans]